MSGQLINDNLLSFVPMNPINDTGLRDHYFTRKIELLGLNASGIV